MQSPISKQAIPSDLTIWPSCTSPRSLHMWCSLILLSLLLYIVPFSLWNLFPPLLLTFVPGFSSFFILFGYRVCICCFIYSAGNSQCFCEAHLSFQESIPHSTLNLKNKKNYQKQSRKYFMSFKCCAPTRPFPSLTDCVFHSTIMTVYT